VRYWILGLMRVLSKEERKEAELQGKCSAGMPMISMRDIFKLCTKETA